VTWVPRAEKSPDRIDALVYSLSMLNLNAYAGSNFKVPHSDIPDHVGTGYPVASNCFEDI
jgi:hypothetical protein